MSCPVKSNSDSGCPIKDEGKKTVIPGYNEAANDIMIDAITRQKDQIKDLSISRAVSSIPKSTYTPQHQPDGIDRWVYPSEQQYYNAMKRKGYSPREDDVPVILAIHNLVNEQGWSEIKKWEAMRGCSNPKLKQFLGRPQDLSPKAYFRMLMGYTRPFDRHDWVVDRNGVDVRYVIDFYQGYSKEPSAASSSIQMHLDVRPALDTPQALLDRLSFGFREYFAPNTLPKSTQPRSMK